MRPPVFSEAQREQPEPSFVTALKKLRALSDDRRELGERD